MNKNKLTYLSPETETLVVRFEGNFCGTGNNIDSNGTQRSTVITSGSCGWDGGWDDDE